MKSKALLYAIALAGALAMTACANNGANGEEPSQPPATATATERPSSEPSASPVPTATPEPSASEQPDKPSEGTQQQASDKKAEQLKKIRKLAREGRVPGLTYTVHSTLIDDVEKDWGEADRTDAAGKGIYATYEKHRAAIGYNKGSVVFDVRSYADDLKSLSLRDIEGTLGKADSVTENGEDEIYVYEVNDQYELKFVIPASKDRVDHISVFSPKDARNNMAG
jgi:hypothetical protein